MIPGPEQQPAMRSSWSRPDAELVFTSSDGLVFHRGVYLPLETALKLLPSLERQVWSQRIARELSDAIAQASEEELESISVHA